ncbi:RecX family transcriptional regulator [Lacicoccus alkaliphilus]|uniref:Regulatory protein RecX n=1 Tax=Lacicoccus alkaliphilus DSM 16010 TaxID=1123231 RepID=A0A1M7KA83_9BACL|nr:RecX family transcriptional regulator [Salinicoccus alkaliphilus]SHM62134.1 regulatory protein [Salinicoccus alkaliphilus DSM 16010]
MIKIDKVSKKKNGLYDVHLSNGDKMTVHEESLVRHRLLSGRELTEEELKDVYESIQYDQAYVGALKYISYKLRSHHEIRDYLGEEYETYIIDDVVGRLMDENYINDEMYAEALKNTMLNTSDKGPGLLERELKKHRIEEDIIFTKTAAFSDAVDSERMNKLKQKELKRYKGSNRHFSMKLQEKLMTKGYYKEHFELIDFDDDFDETPFFEREFDKLYKRYKKKYEGFELKQKVTEALLRKGYAYDLIQEKLGGMTDETIG